MEVAVPDFRIPTNDGGGSSRVSVCTEKRLRQGVKSSITRHRSCQETCDRGHGIYLLAQLTETKTTFVGLYPLNCRPSHLALFVIYVLDQRGGQWSSVCSLQGYGGSYECRNVWWPYHISMLLQGSIMWLTRQPRTHVMCYVHVCSSVCCCLLYALCWAWCS